jgi:hypothetical protein
MDDSAVSADAIKTGVSNDERFENLAANIHEYGKRHDEATCTDKSCGRCGKSTAGPALEGRQRAGDVRPDEGHLPDTQLEPYNPEIVAGGERALHAIEELQDRDPNSFDGWQRLQSEAPAGFTPGGGGGSSGRSMGDVIRGKTSIGACPYCHLQHSKGNKCPSIMEEPRPALVGARVSKRVKAFIENESGSTAGVIVESSVAFMIRMGWTVPMMQAFFDSQIAQADKGNAA